MSQITFNAPLSYTVGQIANLNPTDKVTRPVAEAVVFGQVVSDTDAGVVAFDTVPMGIVARSLINPIARDGSVTIEANASKGAVVVRDGYVAVEVLTDVTRGEAAFVGVDGIAGTDAGDFSAYVEVAGIKFESDASAGDIVLVRVKL